MEISLRDVSAGYGPTPVLHHADLTLRSGELTVLVGPNGAGKSTLLRAITHLIPLSSGQVEISGTSTAALSARDRAKHIAVVPQEEGTAFDFTVRDVVLMGRYAHSAGEASAVDHDAASRAMAQLDILHLASRPVTSLSGGERRRTLIARALAQQAPAILLDEPTAHLDPGHQVELMHRLRGMADSGTLILAALHDLSLAAEYAHQIVLMRAGRIVAQGAPAEVLTTHQLQDAYGIPFRVASNPVSGAPMPIAIAASPLLDHAKRVHLICGGGTGVQLLSSLLKAGFNVSVGVLNRGDTDLVAAQALGLPYIEIPAFSAITPEAETTHMALLDGADALVISEVPWGPGNLANLQAACRLQSAGNPCLLHISGDMRLLDFTEGRAMEILEEMLRNGLQVFSDVDSLLSGLRTSVGT